MAARPKKSYPEERRERQYNDALSMLKHGKMLGYPVCCVLEYFLEIEYRKAEPSIEALSETRAARIAERSKDREIDPDLLKGFIPCFRHMDEIKAGKITVKGLIVGRSKKIQPFPKEGRPSEEE